MTKNNEHPQVFVNPFVILIGFIILASLLQFQFPLPVIPKGASQIVGIILIVLNFFFGFPALRGMLSAKTSPNPARSSTALVFSASYRLTRNPMYIGLLLLSMGGLLFFQITWSFLLLPVAVWLLTIWVIIPEETYLEKTFGEPYVQYKAKVKRWF